MFRAVRVTMPVSYQVAKMFRRRCEIHKLGLCVKPEADQFADVLTELQTDNGEKCDDPTRLLAQSV